jgi:hypothetical protein
VLGELGVGCIWTEFLAGDPQAMAKLARVQPRPAALLLGGLWWLLSPL